MISRVLGLVVAGLLLVGTAGCSSSRKPIQQPLPAGTFAQQLDAIAAQASAKGEELPCISRAFGVTPATATRIADTRRIYAWSYCSGLIGGTNAGSFVPVSITHSPQGWVATEPPDDVGPGDGPFDALFPPDVLSWAGAHPSIAWVKHA
jgi:hypothetical protein